MYTIRGTTHEGGPTQEISLELLGLNDEGQPSQGCSVTHELSDGTYVVRGQGAGPISVNYSGEFPNEKGGAAQQLEILRKMRGRRVEILRESISIGFAVINSVNPTYQNRIYTKYVNTSWRCDMTLEHSPDKVVIPVDTTLLPGT